MPKPRVIGQPTTSQHFTLGLNALADLLAPTLGPIGGVVANQRDHQRKPELLDDSATAVRRILNMGDPRMDVGAMLMRSLVWRVVQRVGDGGATAAILARALHAEAVRMAAAGANTMQLQKGINLAVDAAVTALHEMARPVTHENELAAVALTVIREPELAAVLGEMSYLLGPDAHVTVEKYVAPYLQQYYHPGASYKSQIASMYLYSDSIRKQTVLPAGLIALVDGRLDTAEQVVPFLEHAINSEAKSLTIVAGQFSEEVIGILVANNQNQYEEQPGTNGVDKASAEETAVKTEESEKNGRKLKIVAVKPKDVGDDRRAAFDDLAMLTGATVLGRGWSKAAAQATVEDMGSALRVEVSKDYIHIVPQHRNSPEARQKTTEIRTKLSRMTLDDEDRPLLVKRLAALSGGMGVVKIGAESRLDREVRARNAERALKVLSEAQHSGVVPGGGSAYFHCIPALEDIDAEGDIGYGVDIVRRTLGAPLRQILENAHVASSSVVMDKIHQAGPTATYDVISDKVVDAYEAGVLDVANVMETVLRTAASGALMALTTDAIVYHKNPEQVLNI